MSAPASPVSLELDGPIARITLNRPEARNLVTRAMMLQLIGHLSEATQAADFVILQGNGPDFCLGRDQSERPVGVSREESLSLILEANRLLGDFDGITLVSVRGRAIGFGAGMVLHSDLVVCTDSAVLGFDEVRHGLPPLVVISYLARYIARKRAVELVLTGRDVPASEALALGMVSQVVPDDQLEAATGRLLDGLLASDTGALRESKRYFREVEEVPVAERPRHAVAQLVTWLDSRAAGATVPRH